ncbi:MAG: diguanylate cyclase [Chitinivorax sp.]
MTDENEISSPLPRIVVADDSRIVRATIKKHLNGVFDIVEACDGEEAWALLQHETDIQVLISDLGMPNLDGFGLLERVRSSDNPLIRKLPFIVISGEEEESVKLKAVELGASDFITKSTDRTELIARVSANALRAQTEAELSVNRQELEQKATEDPVTGLGTKHLMLFEGRQSLAYATRHNQRTIVLLLELDRFADVASQYGQPVADQILKALAKMLASKVRSEDTIARVDEYRFGVLSSSQSPGEELVLAERLRTALEHAKINYKGNVIRFTGSIGVLNCEYGTEIEAALEVAEQRLMLARNAGGNLVVAQDEPPAQVPAPTLPEALALLQQGRTQDVQPFLLPLLAQVLPLLELGNQQLLLGMPIDKLKEKLHLR